MTFFYDLNKKLNSIRELPETTYSQLNESAKPDFLDIDKDGDKKEPMKKATATKQAMTEAGEEIAEISRATLKSYASKAIPDMQASQQKAQKELALAKASKSDKTAEKYFNSAVKADDRTNKRMAGLAAAIDRGRKQDGMAEGDHSYMPSGEEVAGKRPEDETVGDKMKKFVKKVANKVAPDDETLMKDLFNKSQGVSEAAKPDFLDIDKDGDTKEDMKKAAADKKAGPKKGVNPFAKEEVKEACGDMPAATGDITISGSADALAMMLKMAGMPAQAAPVQAMHSMEETGFNADGSYNTSDDEANEFDDEEEVDEWANSPAGVEGNEEYQGIEAAIPSGDDLHREKGAYPAAAGGDNPMAIDEEMWSVYQALKADLQ
jgi:hypothetical protein